MLLRLRNRKPVGVPVGCGILVFSSCVREAGRCEHTWGAGGVDRGGFNGGHVQDEHSRVDSQEFGNTSS
jgi:hypothetical protein